MANIALKRPVLLYFYGFPGSGKSFTASRLADQLRAVLVSEEKIRNDLFETPRYNEQENQIVRYVMEYMADQLIKAGISVIYDVNATRFGHRKNLRNIAAQHKTDSLLVWVQIDSDSALARAQNQSAQYSKELFNSQLSQMQNPRDEEYVVVSGKHSFVTQKGAILNRLYQMGLIDSGDVQSNVSVVPGLINLVPMPTAGRVDMSRRNISIG